MSASTLLLAICLAAAPASGASLAERVQKVLETGEAATPAAVEEARAQYGALKRAAPKDARIDRAYLAVLANQRHYRDALPLVEGYLKQHPADLPALRTRIFLELADRRLTAALAHAAELGEAFDQAPPGDAEWTETARFLGTVIGYLELARTDTGNVQAKSVAKHRILRALRKSYLPDFDEGRLVVIERMAALSDKRSDRERRALLEKSQNQESTSAAIDERRDRIEEGKQVLETGSDQLRNAQRQLAVMNAQWAALQQDRAQLGVRIDFAETQFFGYQNQIVNQINNSGLARRNRSSEAVLRANATAAGQTLMQLNQQAVQLDKRLISLRNEIVQATASARQSGQTVSSSQKSLDKDAARLESLEKRAARLETAKPTSRALSSQARALSTYLTFPYDEEKARLLKEFSLKEFSQ